MKSTSSVFTRINGIHHWDERTDAGHAESEFYALGAECAEGLYVKAILKRSRQASQDQSSMRRQGSQSTGAETRFVQAYATRESEVLVRATSRQSERSRSGRGFATENEVGGHRDEPLAKSQIGIPESCILGCTQRQCEIRKDIVDNYRNHV